MTPTRIASVLCLLAVLPGCMDDGYEEVDESCNGNVECPIYWVCNRVTRTCEYEATNRFMGTLTCEYTAAGAQASYSGASDIVAWLGLQGGARPLRVPTNLMAWCEDSGNGTAAFSPRGLDSTGTEYSLNIAVPPRAGAFEVLPINMWEERWQDAGACQVTMRPPGFEEAGVIAESAHGIAVVETDPSAGARVSLYVDIVMQPTQ